MDMDQTVRSPAPGELSTNVSSPLRRFVTMPPPSTTGRTPPTPSHSTYTIGSLRRTFNPISATNLFPDETPDADRASSTTEPAHFSDIDEDGPSPHDDEPPSIDDDVPVMHIAIDTGDVDMGGRTSAPPADMTIGDTNNPTGIDGTIPMGPNDDTHVINSDTAASPTLKRKRKYSPAQIAQRQRRRGDRRSLGAANLAPDGGNTQAGGSGGSRV